ncbi:MAG: hypothetical protein ACRECO_09995 [Xanthobacteraceae bacterium]
MPSATYVLFRRAILERKLIVCVYKGKRREIAPHILGFKRKQEKALVFQFGGETNSTLPPEGEWRCFALDEVDGVQTRDGEWRTGRTHRITQACIDIVDVDVNVPATRR